MSDSDISCSLSPDELRHRRESLLERLLAESEERCAIEEGYRFRFPATDAALALIGRAIETERRCCLFLRFELTVEPNQGPVWLALSGPPGTRAFLEHVLRP